MKKHKPTLLIISTLVTLLIMLIIALFYLEQINVNNIGYVILRSTKIIYLVSIMVLLDQFKERKITIGCSLIFIAWTWNYIDIFITLNEFERIIIDILLYEITSFIGLFFLLYGVYQSFIKNNSLVNDLHNLAFYDPLTKLPNRNMILGVKNSYDIKCKDFVNLNRRSLFVFLNIDDFKLINDNLGHASGDQLLIEFANRLKSFVRHDDLVIRLSADEFLIVIYIDNQEIDVDKLMNRLLQSIRCSYNINHRDIMITCSLGVSIYPDHANNLDEVIRKADIAMYNAKKEGKNTYSLYTDCLTKTYNSRFDSISELKSAIKNEEFIVHYQAKASTTNREITGLEALVRWNHPIKGLVYPNQFIPLLEETGLIKEVDAIVLKTVCKQINGWMNQGIKPFNISVNISPLLFSDKMFITLLDETIEEYEVDSKYLSVEITENIALGDIEMTKYKINKLKSRNIKVYLDDFGKGYSSLTYIKNYPIDYLKIDKSFIDGIIDNSVDQTLVKAIIKISNLMGIRVVSEGVETEEQLAVLKSIGCHEYQGYLLNKPQPIDEFDSVLIN